MLKVFLISSGVFPARARSTAGSCPLHQHPTTGCVQEARGCAPLITLATVRTLDTRLRAGGTRVRALDHVGDREAGQVQQGLDVQVVGGLRSVRSGEGPRRRPRPGSPR